MATRQRTGVVITPPDLVGVDWPEWCARLGLTTLGLHSGGGAAHDVLAALGETRHAAFAQRCAAAGVELEFELHCPHDLLPRELFAAHPRFFAQPPGAEARGPEGNWCISAPGCGELLGANARSLARRLRPSTRRHFFWPADETGGWCHCADCAQLSAADQSLRSTNAIAAAVRQDDPAAEVGWLAYHSTLEVPRDTRPAPGVILEYAPFGRCYDHPINDADCAENRRYWQTLTDLLTWFEPSRAHVLEYWLDSSYFSGWQKPAQKPRVAEGVLAADVAAYRDLGLRSITTFAVYMDGEYFATHGAAEVEQYAAVLGQA